MDPKYINDNVRKLYTNINKKIYIAAFIFFAVILLWTFINKLTLNDKQNSINNNDAKSVYKPTETVISGTDIKESNYIEDEELIKKFINYCNNGEIEQAYNLLSEDCKEIVFNNNQNQFEELYWKEIFSNKREINLKSWISEKKYNTYRVRMIDDIMSTGDYNNSQNYQDYITVLRDENNNGLLNINGFIYKKDVSRKEENDDLEINVNSEILYINNIEYGFKVKNKTNKAILLDTLENAPENIYLELINNKTRSCIPDDLVKSDLLIDSYVTKDIKIKFNQIPTNISDVRKINFKNIVKDYQSYIDNQDDYNDFIEITIDL